MADQIHIKNKKAGFEYHLLETFTAGMVLTGSEIKSIRAGKANINEAFCAFINEGLWVRGMHIAPYEQASYTNHEEKRDRKLLLNQRELDKISKMMQDQGLTIIPTSLFINDRGYAKLGIAVAKGKKLHDKREDLKKKDSKREMDRAMKR
ncbi:MAG: SsrA-binding protein SmpB [Flavobacteriales bacterium]|nr:SsrA-binding protein SmpB [Flavobacteriales bacterium]MCB9448178.1 SsrA-binding protein SmpB [Flavobacteriales bacterium]